MLPVVFFITKKIVKLFYSTITMDTFLRFYDSMIISF